MKTLFTSLGLKLAKDYPRIAAAVSVIVFLLMIAFLIRWIYRKIRK